MAATIEEAKYYIETKLQEKCNIMPLRAFEKEKTTKWRRGAEQTIVKMQKSSTKPQKKPKPSIWRRKQCAAVRDFKEEQK